MTCASISAIIGIQSSKSRPTIARPLFKQLFFLQLFTFETNARQFVTKLIFLLSVSFCFSSILIMCAHLRPRNPVHCKMCFKIIRLGGHHCSINPAHLSRWRSNWKIATKQETRLLLWLLWLALPTMCKHRYASESGQNQFFMPHKFLQERQLCKTSVMRWWNINKSRRKLLLQTARSNEKITCESFANNMARMTS